MDRRDVRRKTLAAVAEIESRHDFLGTIVRDTDASGDPIIAGELQKRLDQLADWLDKMYVWAGNI